MGEGYCWVIVVLRLQVYLRLFFRLGIFLSHSLTFSHPFLSVLPLASVIYLSHVISAIVLIPVFSCPISEKVQCRIFTVAGLEVQESSLI